MAPQDIIPHRPGIQSERDRKRHVPYGSTLAERIAFYSVPHPSGCIFWSGGHSQKGYPQLWWQGKMQRVSRLVWEWAKGPLSPGMCALHKCDDPGCINLDCLFDGTQIDNIADREAKGRGVIPDNRGERNAGARLTPTDIVAIRTAAANGATGAALARQFGVGQPAISMIINRKSWRHI